MSDSEVLSGASVRGAPTGLLRRVAAPGLFRDNAVLLTLSMAINILGFAFQLAMARLLAPAAYAEMFAVLSLLALLSVPSAALNTLSIKMTGEFFVQGRGAELWKWVVRTVARIGAPGLLLALGFALASGWISKTLQLDSRSGVVVAGIAMFLTFVNIIPRGALAGTRSFLLLGIVGMAETATRLVAAMVMVLAGLAAAGAIGGSAAGAFVSILLGGVALRMVISKLATGAVAGDEELPDWGDQLRVVAISLALAVMFNADVLFVKHYFSQSDAARYSAIALAGRTVFFAAAPVSIVLLPHTIRAFKSGASVLPGILQSLGLILALVAVTAAVILVFPGQVFRVVFGGRYEPQMQLLFLYAAAGTLLAINTTLAQLHIGVGDMRVWRVLALLAGSMVVAMQLARGSMSGLASTLALTSAITLVYLTVETALLIRRAQVQRTAPAA